MVNKSVYVTRSTDFMGTQTEGVAVSSTSTYYSLAWSSEYGTKGSVGIFWTGTPTGALTLWFSDKAKPSLTDDTDWHQDTSESFTDPAGSASKTGDNWSNANAKWWRLKYVNAGGSGVLSAFITTSEV